MKLFEGKQASKRLTEMKSVTLPDSNVQIFGYDGGGKTSMNVGFKDGGETFKIPLDKLGDAIKKMHLPVEKPKSVSDEDWKTVSDSVVAYIKSNGTPAQKSALKTDGSPKPLFESIRLTEGRIQVNPYISVDTMEDGSLLITDEGKPVVRLVSKREAEKMMNAIKDTIKKMK